MYDLQLLPAAARRHGLPVALVAAVVEVESSGNPWAWNPEPPYRWLWNVRTGQPFRPLTAAELVSEVPPSDFPCLAGDRDQEWWGQQASWGLMQVMGSTAREFGFLGHYLPQLCQPEIGLEWGCRVLAERWQWAGRDEAGALAAYNGGKAGNHPSLGRLRTAEYAVKVLRVRDRLAGYYV